MALWVKICANTNLEDALQAAQAGADAVGFVFAPSRRQVTPEQVAKIVPHLPQHVEKVGVFAFESVRGIAQAVEACGLTSVQLHGGVDLEFAARLRPALGRAVTLIHTAHWRVGHDDSSAELVRAALRELAGLGGGAAPNQTERLLIDAKIGNSSGGLGVAYDWAAAARVLGEHRGLRVISAGGLRPDTVADAVRTLRPYGVDVASGVEREPGRKDHAKVVSFIENARNACRAPGF